MALHGMRAWWLGRDCIIHLYSRAVLPNTSRMLIFHGPSPRRSAGQGICISEILRGLFRVKLSGFGHAGGTLATAVLLICGMASGFGQTSSSTNSTQFPFIVNVWESGAGDQKLPENSVIAITQTRDGYLWLGTLGGLVRFDGTRFTVFNKANTPRLDNRIVFLFQDSQSNLWVGTERAGMVLIKAGGEILNFEIGKGNPAARLISACEDKQHIVWLLTGDGHLCRYQNGNFSAAPVGCKAIAVGDSGDLLLGTDIGLFTAPAGNQLAFVQVTTWNGLDFLLASKSGGFWRLANGQMEKWRNGKVERQFACAWNPQTTINAACEDANGNLIVGTQGEGVFWFDADGHATQISTAQGLSPGSRGIVLSLWLDREGNLWVGTNGGGLNRIKRRIFQVLPGSENWTVQSVCRDSDDGLWIGTFGRGLKHFQNGGMREFTPLRGLTNAYVPSVAMDREGNVWFGFFGPGNFGVGQIAGERIVFQREPSVASQLISAIFQDSSGKIWFGTQNGLACKDGAKWRRFTTTNGLSSDFVRAIAEDNQGSLWIGTENGGLNCLSNGQFTSFRSDAEHATETVTSLTFDHDGALWIGTDAGLKRFRNGKWSSFFARNGLLSDSIGYLIEDTQSNLWIGSYAGLARAPIQMLNDFADKKTNFITCRAFGASDGFLTSECTQGSQPAACIARDGRIWFPTINGLVSVNPAELKPNTNPPPVIIESVRVESQEQITNEFGARVQSVTIPASKERLEIHYTSLNFSAPENVRFKYQLVPHESHWIEAGNIRVVAYSKLPPGEYQFRVTAYNEDGLAASEGATLAVLVQPAFWQTKIFRIVVVLCLLGLVGGVIYYFSTQKLQRELAVMKQHEELERERSRIARDLHDQLGANLTQITLLGEMTETDKDVPQEVESNAQQICQTARETTHALDEIVWAVNPSNDTLEGLVNYACKYAQEYLELAGISHRFEVPAQLPKANIAPDVRHNVFLAFKESVNNVVKHAHATSVSVRLHLSGDSFTLEVQDNGRGLPKENGDSTRNGLRNMRKRMEDIGGNFSIGAAAEQGTIVQLTAPVRRV
jgi:ligand-binding sensor domain-containing protein/signal transduction histidine kinase